MIKGAATLCNFSCNLSRNALWKVGWSLRKIEASSISLDGLCNLLQREWLKKERFQSSQDMLHCAMFHAPYQIARDNVHSSEYIGIITSGFEFNSWKKYQFGGENIHQTLRSIYFRPVLTEIISNLQRLAFHICLLWKSLKHGLLSCYRQLNDLRQLLAFSARTEYISFLLCIIFRNCKIYMFSFFTLYWLHKPRFY